MDISAVTGSGSSTGSVWSGGAVGAKIAGKEFFHMLLTEMQNQDPFEPVKHSELLSQLAQFSTLEQTEGLSQGIWELVASQRLSEGVNLIGKEVEYVDPQTGGLLEGIVTSVQQSSGDVYAEIGEDLVPLGWIARVSSPSEAETENETENESSSE